MKALLLAVTLANPILFVTQVPVPADFTTVASTFGNHLASVAEAPRGGDLWIRYPDGAMKNLTRMAGFGNSGMQGAASIAVREPSVHWSGTKALFSMVAGAPSQQYVWETYYWQIYELTGLGENETPAIRKIPNQPASYDNVSPFYGTDDRILFTSDRPRSGERHLYQRVEIFPEPRSSRTDLLAGTNLLGNSINHFFPWEMYEDGTSEETMNHVGRHELFGYFDRSMNDSGLSEFFGGGRNVAENLFQLREDPAQPGVYYGVDAPEFQTHASGQIVRFGAEPSRTADNIAITYITPRST